MFHPAAGLLQHICSYGAPVTLLNPPTPAALLAAKQYGCHSSAAKDATFIRQEIVDQVMAGHVVVMP
eukprot:12341875-Ditylum_brightwellii.AAC.1